MSAELGRPTLVRGRSGVRQRLGFLVMAAVLGLFLAAAAAPSPLYATYAVQWHFSATTLTVTFAVYALALLATLLTTGSLSDSLGRRPVVFAALAVQALSMVMFLLAQGVAWLLAARVTQGLATGLVTAAVAASLLDLAPPGHPALGSLVNAVMPTAGLAFGALAAGALVQYGPDPLRLVYAALLAAFLLAGAAMIVVPMPATARRPVSLRPRLGVDPALRGAFWAVLPCLVATWALGGLYLSLGPSLIESIAGSTNRLLGGSIVFALCAAGALAGVAVRNWAARTAMRIGCALLVAGLAVTAVAIEAASGLGLTAGTVVAGFGFGSAFLGAFRSLVAGACPAGRGALIATIYLVSYLAFSLPVIAAGMLTTRLGLHPTAIAYAAVVAVLAAAAWLADMPHRGADPGHS